MYPKITDGMVQASAYSIGIGVLAMRRIVSEKSDNGDWFNRLLIDEITQEDFSSFMREMDEAMATEDVTAMSDVIDRLKIPTEIKDMLISSLKEGKSFCADC